MMVGRTIAWKQRLTAKACCWANLDQRLRHAAACRDGLRRAEHHRRRPFAAPNEYHVFLSLMYGRNLDGRDAGRSLARRARQISYIGRS
jgi:hypothetical protein